MSAGKTASLKPYLLWSAITCSDKGLLLHQGTLVSTLTAGWLTGTAKNVSDLVETHKLLHSKEEIVLVDAGYTCIAKREDARESGVV